MRPSLPDLSPHERAVLAQAADRVNAVIGYQRVTQFLRDLDERSRPATQMKAEAA
jgi:hypothetical protein